MYIESGDMILKQIINMEREVERLKEKIFTDDEKSYDITNDIKKLEFIEDKLNVLEITELDDRSKKKCKRLMTDIKKLKNHVDYREYTNKVDIIEKLRDVTSSNNDYHRLEVVGKVNDILASIRLTESNLYEILDDDLVYYNDLKIDLEGDKGKIDWDKRMEDAQFILDSVFHMVYDSYSRSSSPFDIYEKIMLINALDTVRKILSSERSG